MDDSARAVENTEMAMTMPEGVPEVMAEDMPMARAPSVALSGSAKMGLKRVDDNTKADDEDIKTVVEYEVSFSSQGVTDGGLKFGASISIDEEGKGAADSNGVNAAAAYIGSTDGTWKLQFGSNDPGIDLVGNVGLADADKISGMTLTVLPLMYTDGTTMKQMQLAKTVFAAAAGMTGTSTLDDYSANPDWTNPFTSATGGFASHLDTPIFHIKPKGTLTVPRDGVRVDFKLEGSAMPAPPPGRSAIALTGSLSSVSYALTAGEGGSDAWSVGAKYDSGVVNVGLGLDSNDVMAVGAGGTFAGNTVKATYVKLDDAKTYFFRVRSLQGTDGATMNAKEHTVNEMEVYGLSFARDVGAGSNIALTYSRLTDKTFKTFAGTKQWELDFTYDLGGGASFYAGIEQADMSKFTNSWTVKVAGQAGDNARQTAMYTPIFKKSKVTTLETGITMKF